MGVFLEYSQGIELYARYGAYLKAGVRPKNATKVRSETVTVKMTMARKAVIVKGQSCRPATRTLTADGERLSTKDTKVVYSGSIR